MRLVFSIVVVLTMVSTFAQGSYEKLIVKKWKLVKEFDKASEIEPKHEHLIMVFKKSGDYTIKASYEESHSGKWRIGGKNNNRLILHDEANDEEKMLSILQLDKNHLNLGNFDGPTTIVHFTPMEKNREEHLNHKEHLIAKKWHVFESGKAALIHALYEFKEDYTFFILPEGHKVPLYTGKWSLSNNKKELLIHRREDGKDIIMEIIEIHTHVMVLKNKETDDSMTFHDLKLTAKDKQKLREGSK